MLNKQKILFISPFYYPEKISSAKYNKYLVDSLISKLNVDVYCMHPFYPDWKSKRAIGNKNTFRPEWLPSFPKSMFLKRLILEFGFLFNTLLYLSKNKKKYGGVICISPPSLFLLVSIFFNKKIVIIHDLQSIHSLESTFIIKFFSRFIRVIEKFILSKFNNKYFLSNEMSKSLNLTNSFVFYPPFNVIRKKNLSFEKKFNFNKNTIIYSGALGEKQNPLKLMEFIKMYIHSHNNFCCYIFSSGPLFEYCKEKFSSKKINFHSLVKEKDLFSLYNNDAIHLIPQKRKTSRGSLPSKLANLVYCNSKLISITDKNSELDDILSNFENNIRIYNWSYNEFSCALNDLAKIKRKKNSSKNLYKFSKFGFIDHITNYFNEK